MQVTIVSDINQWSAFFDSLLKTHAKLRGSAFNRSYKTQTWGLKLINTAVTLNRHGQAFPYFDAVDKGRSAISTRFFGKGIKGSTGARFLFFAGNPGVVTTQQVRAAQGAQITTKALAQTYGKFDAELTATFDRWLLKAQESAIEGGVLKRGASGVLRVGRGSRAGAGILRQRISESERDLADMDAADRFFAEQGVSLGAEGEIIETPIVSVGEENFSGRRISRVLEKGTQAYTAVMKRLLTQSKLTFDEKKLIGDAALAAGQAAERDRISSVIASAQARSAFRFRIGGFGLSEAGQQQIAAASRADQFRLRRVLTKEEFRKAVLTNPAIQKLVKIPNWYALAAIFAKTTGDQIEGVWKPLTPSRKLLGRSKIGYSEGGQLSLFGPETGGSLKQGYKLVTNNQLQKLIAGSV